MVGCQSKLSRAQGKESCLGIKDIMLESCNFVVVCVHVSLAPCVLKIGRSRNYRNTHIDSEEARRLELITCAQTKQHTPFDMAKVSYD